MSKARDSVARMMEALDAGGAPRWARRTEFLPLDDGSYLRRVTRSDGTVEKEEVIAAERCLSLAARSRTGLSQAQFAALLGISVRTLHDWEQGRREPSGAARTLLKIASRHPEVLREVLNEA